MHWGSTCLQVCNPEPQHQIMQTDNGTPFLWPEDAGFLVSAKEAELQLFNQWTSTQHPSLPSGHPSQEAQLKQLGESQRVKKEGFHAGEYGCRGFMSLRNDDNPGSSCIAICFDNLKTQI